MAKPTPESETVVPTVDGIDTLMQTMGVGSALPSLDPTDPSLKTETKRIWSRVKKDEKRAQLGEIQRTSIAMPLEIHTQVRVAAVQRRESFNDWIMEAVQQRLERDLS